MPQYVEVHNAPGFEEFWRAILVPGLGEIPAVDSRGILAVVTDESGIPFVVPAKCVRMTEEVPPWE